MSELLTDDLEKVAGFKQMWKAQDSLLWRNLKGLCPAMRNAD